LRHFPYYFFNRLILLSNVGIGTTTPFGSLAVNNIAGQPGFVVGSSTATSFIVGRNGNVGVGTANPAFTFTVGTVTTALTAQAFKNSIGIITPDTIVFNGVNTTASGLGQGANVGLYSDDGSAVVNGDRLGGFFFGGNDGSNGLKNGAGVFGFAQGTWTSTSIPSYLTFDTAPSGSATRVERLRVDSNGNIGIATSTPVYRLTSFSATNPQLSLSAGAGLAQWVMRNAGGDFSISTTTVAGTATTSTAAFTILNNGNSFWRGLTTATNNDLCINATTFEITQAASATCVSSTKWAKHDINKLDDTEVIAIIEALRPITYKANEDNTEHYGFIAEEVDALSKKQGTEGARLLVSYASKPIKYKQPDGSVHTVKVGEPASFDYERYTALLTRYVQIKAGSFDTTRKQSSNSYLMFIVLLAGGLAIQQIQIYNLKTLYKIKPAPTIAVMGNNKAPITVVNAVVVPVATTSDFANLSVEALATAPETANSFCEALATLDDLPIPINPVVASITAL